MTLPRKSKQSSTTETESTTDLTGYKDNPVAYLEIFGPVWGKMRDIANSLLVNQYTAVRSATGTSKTHTAAALMLWWLDVYRPHARVVSTAKTIKQVETVLWARLRSLWHDVGDRFEGARPDTLQFYPNKDLYPEWLAFGVNPKVEMGEATAFQGQHSKTGHVLFVFEEANTIDPAVFVAAEGSLDAANARILGIYNPNVARGVVHGWEKDGTVSIEKGNLITISRYDLFNDPNYPAMKALGGMPTEERTAAMVKKYGIKSPIVRIKVLGEYPLSDTDAAIQMDIVEAARDRHTDGLDIGRLIRQILIWDVAGEGQDDNELGLLEMGTKGSHFKFLSVPWDNNHKKNMKRVSGIITKLKEKRRKRGGVEDGVEGNNDNQSNIASSPDEAQEPDLLPHSIELIVDAIGEGSHVPSFMEDDHPDIRIIAFKGGAAAGIIPEIKYTEFTNLNSEAWYRAKLLLEGDYWNPIAIDINEQTVHELTSRIGAYTDKRGEAQIWTIESKRGKKGWMARNNGQSPDRADCFIMGAYAMYGGKKKKKFGWAKV